MFANRSKWMEQHTPSTLIATVGSYIALALSPIVLVLVLIYETYRAIVKPKVKKTITGDVAVITGSAQGLGRAIAIRLAKEGCHVAIVDVDLEKAEDTARFIVKAYGVKAKAYKVDVSNYEDVIALNEYVSNDLGPVTILVNNAGIMLFKNQLDPDIEDIQRMINVNLTAHFVTKKVFLPKMKELKRGHIVAISSIAGFFATPYMGPYCCTKFGVRALMRSLDLELLSNNYNNIRTTTVFPYFLHTNLSVVKYLKAIKYDKMLVHPLVSGDKAAERIVRAIVCNETEVALPDVQLLIGKIFEFIPITFVQWIIVQLTKYNLIKSM